MEYRIEYMRQALEDSKRLKANEPKAFKKLEKLVAELRKHPRRAQGIPSNSRVSQRAAGAAVSLHGTG